MSVVAHDEAQSLKERIFTAAIVVFAEHGPSGRAWNKLPPRRRPLNAWWLLL